MTSHVAQATVVTTLDVRHANHDITGFVARIIELLASPSSILVDLSRHEEHGNRILLQAINPGDTDEITWGAR